MAKTENHNRINEKLKAFPAWNATSIDDRHGILIELAKDVWRTAPLEG
jgi:hypothetical protein